MHALVKPDLIRPMDPKGIPARTTLEFADAADRDRRQRFSVPLSAGLEGLIYNTTRFQGGSTSSPTSGPAFRRPRAIQRSFALRRWAGRRWRSGSSTR